MVTPVLLLSVVDAWRLCVLPSMLWHKIECQSCASLLTQTMQPVVCRTCECNQLMGCRLHPYRQACLKGTACLTPSRTVPLYAAWSVLELCESVRMSEKFREVGPNTVQQAVIRLLQGGILQSITTLPGTYRQVALSASAEDVKLALKLAKDDRQNFLF